MLVLTCMRGKAVTLTVPPSDEPTIIEIVPHPVQRGDRVRLCFAAPRDVEIVRYDAIDRERKESA